MSTSSRRRAGAALLCSLAWLAASPASAGDAAAGRQKATVCATCHGANGLSMQPDAPNLAGQPEVYLAAQLKAYKSGARKHEIMTLMAQPLSDDDIANLAAWFASIHVDAKAPD